MTQNSSGRKGPQTPRDRRVRGNKFVTKSGKSVKVHMTIAQRAKALRDAKSARRAERLRGLPKSRFKRFLYRLNPKRVAKYWFSRDGLIMGMKILGIAIIVGFVMLVGVFSYFRKDLPNLRDISGTNIGGSIRYFDRTGKTLLWEDYDAVKRIPVNDEEIATHMKGATVAVEDREFFSHGGFNVKGITRAAWNNAFGGSTQGGSTITQQLVKLTTPGFTNDHTVTRKIKELILSVEMERSYSKKQILTGYLNAAPYGGIEYGVEAASRNYFAKSAKDLTLSEASFLAAIPKSPRYYSPYSPDFDKEAFLARQHFILNVMNEAGMITKEQRDEAKKVDVIATVKPRQPKYNGIVAPYFVLAAKNQLENKFGEKTYNRGGWKVTTSLNMDLQKIADEEVTKGIRQVQRQGGDTAAFVAEDVKTGQVVALVGGADFNDKARAGEINFAQQPLPPGSSFKPYDYAALIEHTNNFGAGSVLYDSIGKIDGYPCTTGPKKGGNCAVDYDFRFPGPLTLRYALGGSRNIPAMKAMLIAGVDKTINTAEKLGLESGYKCYEDQALSKQTQCYVSSSIGDGAFLHLDEHVHAYASLSRNGNKLPQTYIMKIEDANNKVVDEWKLTNGEQVVRPDTAYIVSDMMSDPRASYFSRKPHNYKGWKFSLKTGTTNDAKDGWLMGFSTQYSAGVWVGYHSRQRVMSGFMENMTQPIWQGWMNRVHADMKPEDRVKPPGVQTLPAYVVRSHVGVGSIEPSPTNDLFPSWYQKPTNKAGKKRTIDVVSNKLATDCTPARAKKEVTDSDAATFSGDIFYNAGGNSDEKDDVHKCEDGRPTITAFSVTPVPGEDGQYSMSATIVQGTHPLSSSKYKGTVNFRINGQILPGGSFEIGNSGDVTFVYTSQYEGAQTISVEAVDSVLYDVTATLDRNLEKASGDEDDEDAYLSPRFNNGNNRRRSQLVGSR